MEYVLFIIGKHSEECIPHNNNLQEWAKGIMKAKQTQLFYMKTQHTFYTAVNRAYTSLDYLCLL